MKVLVAGAGAIGGWLASRLGGATMLGRPALAQAVAASGLIVKGHTTYSGRPRVITAPEAGFDVVIITTKAHATAAMAEALASLNPDATFVTFQNGIGNAEAIGRFVAPEQIVVGLTSHGVSVESPGVLRHAGTGMVRLGAYPGNAWNARGQAVLDLFSAGGLAPERVDDVTGHIWLKAMVNHGINPLCAIHGIQNGGLAAHMDEADALVDEALALSRAAGIRLPDDPLRAMHDTVAATAENRCSMLQDVEARRPTEIEHITGYFMRLARRLGYPLFASEDIYRRVKAIEAGYLGEAQSLALAKAAADAFVAPDSSV